MYADRLRNSFLRSNLNFKQQLLNQCTALKDSDPEENSYSNLTYFQSCVSFFVLLSTEDHILENVGQTKNDCESQWHQLSSYHILQISSSVVNRTRNSNKFETT